MLIDAVQRAETAVAEMVACAKRGDASSSDMRVGLERSKAIAAMLAVFQTTAAATTAVRERHGDGGAGILRHAAGLSRRQAESHVKTAEALQSMPAVRDAAESGRISFANAGHLARAGETAGAEAVQSDSALVSKAESMSEDQFAREARRWTARRQPDGGEADYRRKRERRSVRFWNGDDGMTHLKAELDPVTGERIRNRLEDEARRLYKGDKKAARASGADRRTFRQCMADALDRTTAGSGDNLKRSTGGRGNAPHPLADIAVVAHLDDESSRIVAQLANGEPLPDSILQELMCRSAITPLLYGSNGVPLWRGVTKRSATAAQHQALVARDGACSGCRANPALCEDHHVRPVAEGGPTNITNMTLLCWDCHIKVHRHGWRVVPSGGGRFTVEPPERVCHGPAIAPAPPPERRSGARHVVSSGHRSGRGGAADRGGPPSRDGPVAAKSQEQLFG